MDVYLLVSLSVLLAVVTGKPAHTEDKKTANPSLQTQSILRGEIPNAKRKFVEADDSLEKSELSNLENAWFSLENLISKDIGHSSQKSLILNALKNHEERNLADIEGTHIAAQDLSGSTTGRQRRSAEHHRRRSTDQDAEPRTELDKTAELCREICRRYQCPPGCSEHLRSPWQRR